MNILVTGGAGYIGSNTCKALYKAGYTPIVYDNLSTGHQEFVKWGKLVCADIRDTTQLIHTMQEYNIEGVIHFAASINVGESVTNPGKYFYNNILGTLSLLEAMVIQGIRSIVVSSTCAVYDTQINSNQNRNRIVRLLSENSKLNSSEISTSLNINEETVKLELENISDYLDCTNISTNNELDSSNNLSNLVESTNFNPLNPYGISKATMEQMLESYNKAYGLSFAALRYFNASGADENLDTGEWHTPETHLIPRILMAASGLIPKLEIFGDDYNTKDGTCIRDYIHVTDLADAHVRALNYIIANEGGYSFNLGTGKGYSVKEILSTLENLIGEAIPHAFMPRRAGDAPSLVAYTGKVKTFLGWEPKHSDIENILITALNWHNKLINANKFKSTF